MMAINLQLGARATDQFYVQDGPPVIASHFDWWVIRWTTWTCAPGSFTSWWFIGHLQWYYGSAKCDGTRTRMAWSGQLGDVLPASQYVMTRTPAELSAFRWRANGPGDPVWDNMGGS